MSGKASSRIGISSDVPVHLFWPDRRTESFFCFGSELTAAMLFCVDGKGVFSCCLGLFPRVALALVIAQAGSAIGAVVVEGPVAVHAFSPHDLPVDEGGYEVIPHL